MTEFLDINTEIIELWRTHPDECGSKIPFLYPPCAENCILFIGFNPSFPQVFESRSWAQSYDIGLLDKIDVPQIIKQEIEAQYSLPYFNPLKKIATQMGLPWSHFDVFMFRENSQEQAKLRVLVGKDELKPFGRKQFELFTKALQRCSPKIIVVINAAASDVLKANLGLRYEETDGCYYSRIENVEAPFFLGGMLTGQRALDVYSRSRLIWHIQLKLKRFLVAN